MEESTTTELATIEAAELVPGDEALKIPASPEITRIMSQINQFHIMVNEVLNPATDFMRFSKKASAKPALLKSGAEKIARLLELTASYDISESVSDWDRGRFQFTVKTTLTSLRTGVALAQGVGECNSYETKYRYRWLTAQKLKSEHGYSDAEIKELRFRPTKYGGQHRIENPDPADDINTLMKMAKKRSFVDAVLSVAALSDVFTQDLEDMPHVQSVDARASSVSAAPSGPQLPRSAEELDAMLFGIESGAVELPADAEKPFLQRLMRMQAGQLKSRFDKTPVELMRLLVGLEDWQTAKTAAQRARIINDMGELLALVLEPIDAEPAVGFQPGVDLDADAIAHGANSEPLI